MRFQKNPYFCEQKQTQNQSQKMKNAEDMVVNAELKSRIVEAAKSLFLEKGIRAVTMDEVSRYLHISKRTLYQVICDKEELILLCYEAETREQTKRIESEIAEGNDIMTIIIHHLDYMLQVADNISMSTIKDLQRFPRLQEAARQRRMMLEDRFVNFFALGVEQGVFEADVDYRLLFRFINSGRDRLNKMEIFHYYSPREVFLNTGLMLLRGCATAAGREQLDALRKKALSSEKV